MNERWSWGIRFDRLPERNCANCANLKTYQSMWKGKLKMFANCAKDELSRMRGWLMHAQTPPAVWEEAPKTCNNFVSMVGD